MQQAGARPPQAAPSGLSPAEEQPTPDGSNSTATHHPKRVWESYADGDDEVVFRFEELGLQETAEDLAMREVMPSLTPAAQDPIRRLLRATRGERISRNGN